MEASGNLKIDQMIWMDRANPKFRFNQFIKSLIYNCLFMMLLGPLSAIIIMPIQSKTFCINLAFFPGAWSTN